MKDLGILVLSSIFLSVGNIDNLIYNESASSKCMERSLGPSMKIISNPFIETISFPSPPEKE